MKEYCKQYQKPILLALLFSLVCFGFMLTNFTVTIDEETWLLGNEESMLCGCCRAGCPYGCLICYLRREEIMRHFCGTFARSYYGVYPELFLHTRY